MCFDQLDTIHIAFTELHTDNQKIKKALFINIITITRIRITKTNVMEITGNQD